jgi:hypothetical protein
MEYDLAGNALRLPTPILVGGPVLHAALAAIPGGYALAWTERRRRGADVWYREIDTDGLGPATRVSGDAPFSDRSAVVWDGTAVAVAWTATHEGKHEERWLRRICP